MAAITLRSVAVPAALLAASLVAAYPVYLWTLKREEARLQTAELARFDDECRLARFRLSQGGEFWSARIMANRCAAAGR